MTDSVDKLSRGTGPSETSLLTEWRSNARLRVGVVLIGVIIVFWLLLLAHDHAATVSRQGDELRSRAELLRPFKGQTQWARRAEDVVQLTESAKQLQWTAPSAGAAEARLQDYVRALAGKIGLNVVEISMLPSATPTGAAAGSPAQGLALRLRLVVEFNRQSFMVLLSELQGSVPMLMVERMQIKPAAVPPRAELELRAQIRVEERQP